MKNTYGNSISLTIFGESHGTEIGVVLDGLAPGIPVDEKRIEKMLSLRRPSGKISTKRVEPDHYRIVSGVFDGHTTGTPVCILIPNENTRSKDYSATRFLARPGHADYTAFCKYHGYEDYRGGGHFSGRITAPVVAAGAILMTALEAKGIYIGTHIAKCAGTSDRVFYGAAGGQAAADGSEEAIRQTADSLRDDIRQLSDMDFAVLDPKAAEKMRSAIEDAAGQGDSVGGILETAVTGLPAGLGEPWFDSVESQLAHALFAIPAVKGVEFGAGFAMADMKGSQANDPYVMAEGKVSTKSNNNGGINGGISNGMPIIFRCAVKPTPSIYREQDTIDFLKSEDAKLTLAGRHDPAIVHRARIVADAITALVVSDMLAMRFGTDYLQP